MLRLLCLINACFVITALAAPPGVVIAHRPKDTQDFIGSPALIVLEDGTYLAAHDLFGPGENNGSRIYASQDQGLTWTLRATLPDQDWSSFFLHRGSLYFMGRYWQQGKGIRQGRLAIRRSTDDGKSWTIPRGPKSGLFTVNDLRCATGPVTVTVHGGRIWRCVEHSAKGMKFPRQFQPFLLSAAEEADLLDFTSWKATNLVKPDFAWLSKTFGGWLEGNVISTPEGLRCLMRVQTIVPKEYAATLTPTPDGSRLHFDAKTGFSNFPGGAKKSCVRPDPRGGGYWALSNIIPAGVDAAHPAAIRNTLGLLHSPDLKTWEICATLLHHEGKEQFGFQYPDFQFDGEDLIFVSRTAWENADDYHNADHLTFHRVPNFRALLPQP
ncbi:MAG: exo-alpha-sialidase [Verrucomicrobiaceae bacterium]|nr:exo-alpha-sialidase [Verrucomicrobiaceae bacterium]